MFTLKQIRDKFDFANKHNAVGVIGLDFSIEKLQLVQFEQGPEGEIMLRAHATVAYPASREEILASPKAMKVLIRQALKLAPFSGNRVVTILPSSEIKIISVSYKITKGRSDDEAILGSLVNRLDGDLADYVIDYLPLRAQSRNDESLALVVIAKRNRVVDFLESMRAAGLSVEALDVAPSAINRLITSVSNIEEIENILVINLGHRKSYMTLISGRRLLFDQEIEFGEEGLLEQIATSLDIELEQARDMVRMHGLVPRNNGHINSFQNFDSEIPETLAEIIKPKFMKLVDEINRVLIYAASETRGEPVKHVYLLGSIARWQGADRLLNQMVKIPVSLPNLLSIFGNATDCGVSEDTVPEMALATGLALRGMTEHA